MSEPKILYGTPQFILTYDGKWVECNTIVKDYGNKLSKLKSFNIDSTKKLDDVLKHIVKCLSHYGYDTYTEFVTDFNQKTSILKSTYVGGQYKYSDVVIKKNFLYLGSKSSVENVSNGNSNSIYTHYYEHVNCGGCVKELKLNVQNNGDIIYVCKKCGNIYNDQDINRKININLRSKPPPIN